MTILLHILVNNIVPMGVVVGLGILLHKAFSMDIKTLSKLNFYLFSPAVIFHLLYRTDISFKVISDVMLFILIFTFAQWLIVETVVRLRRYSPSMKSAMRGSVMFYNSANYGIPLNQLAFSGNPYTLSIQLLVMVVQSLLPNTYGIYSVNAHKLDKKKVWRTILSMPVIYAIPLAFLMRYFQIPLPEALGTPIKYISDGFISIALLTLGVQLGHMSWRISRSSMQDVALSSALRLIVGPLLAWFIVWQLPVDPLMAAALIVSSAVPTSLTSVLIAVEFDNEPAFSSQAVLVSTVTSIITITAVIYFLQPTIG